MSYQQADRQAALLANGLDELARVVENQVGLIDAARHIQTRADSVRSDRFKVVVVGGFSRGKSTLLNAVLGCDVLPQKVTPSTAIITLIEYSDQPRARVCYQDEMTPDEHLTLDEFRRRFVLNEKDFVDGVIDTDRFSRIDHAVVSYPIEICRHRVELVDSPGLQDDPIRTARTKKFLKRADAVVMVLDATTLLTEEEVHFLETVLLPDGFTNIFFVINKWNLVDQSVLRPEDAEHEFAALESRIRDRLAVPFCVTDGKDRSADRIFRVNALGALKGRMRKPPSAAMLEDSNVPAFEESLQRFLVEERGKARNEVILGAVKTTRDEVNRFIATQMALAGKSIAEVEAEQVALQPKLERLRGIRKHIIGFLESQSSNLQDRLVVSFQRHIKSIEKDLPNAVGGFGLDDLTKGTMIGKALTDWMREPSQKFAAKVDRHLTPQVNRYFERRLIEWQMAVARNEMQAVMIDVEKHLQEEADEYQRVIREIEEKIGIDHAVLQIKDLVQRWLGASETGPGSPGHVSLSGVGLGAVADMSWLIGGLATDIALHTTGALVPVIGLIITGFRLYLREKNIRKEMETKLVEGLRQKLSEVADAQASLIRERVREGFDGLKKKIASSIDEEVAIIDASLQAILDRKREKEFSSDQERARLEKAREAIAAIVTRIQTAL